MISLAVRQVPETGGDAAEEAAADASDTLAVIRSAARRLEAMATAESNPLIARAIVTLNEAATSAEELTRAAEDLAIQRLALRKAAEAEYARGRADEAASRGLSLVR